MFEYPSGAKVVLGYLNSYFPHFQAETFALHFTSFHHVERVSLDICLVAALAPVLACNTGFIIPAWALS